MGVSDAETGDIYVDARGKLWRVTLVVSEPTVTVEEVEGCLYDPGRPTVFQQPIAGQLMQAFSPAPAEIRKTKQSHFIGNSFWDGFTRIWRKT